MPPKVVDSTDLNRGKYFAEICDRLFPGLSNKAIGEALGGYPESTIRTWKAGTSIGNTAIYHLSKMGVAMPFLFKGEGAMLVGDQNTPPAEASGDLAQKTLTAVFQTQAALSAFGQHLVSGQSAKAFPELPSLRGTVQDFESLLEGLVPPGENPGRKDRTA